jgi:hypothetical protein
MSRLVVGFALACATFCVASASPASDREAEAAALADRAEAGSAEAIAELLPLLHDPDSKVRYHAEWGLARAGAPAVPALIRELRRLQTDEERARVARLLGRVGLVAETAIPELRDALAEPDSSTAGAASYALGHLRAREAVPDLVEAYVASRKIPNQRKMGRALRDIGSDQGARTARVGLVDSVSEDLESDDPRTRAASVAYTCALYRAVLSDNANDFPTKAQLRVLVPGLVAALEAVDLKVAEQAVKTLTLAGRDAADAVPELEGLIGHPQLHHVAIQALLAVGSPEAERVVAERRALERLEERIRSNFSVPDHQGRSELLLFRLAGSAEDGLRMSVRFLYPGREPRAPTHVVIYLESTSMEPRFAEVREITWLANGVPVRMTGLDRSWSRSQLGGVIEHVSAALPVESFRTIANARELGANAGGVEFALGPGDLAALRHFAGKIPVTSDAL